MADSGQRTADGGRRTADGGRRMADGGRRMADSGRQTADGGRRTRTADSGQRTADGGRRTADGGRRTTTTLGQPPSPQDGSVRATRTGFIGSAACLECHAKKRAGWQSSWHARALAHGDRAALVGNFRGAHFTGSSSEAWMQRRDDRAIVRTRGPSGTLADFPVDWVIGGKRMQDDVTVFPDGRWQVLPVYFQVTQKQMGRLHRGQAGTARRPTTRSTGRTCAAWRIASASTATSPGSTSASMSPRAAGRPSSSTPASRARTATDRARATPRAPPRQTSSRPSERRKSSRSPLARSVTARAIRSSRCSMPITASVPGQRYEDFYDPVVVLIAASTPATSSPTDGPSRRASSIRRCCSRLAIARAARPA